MEPQTEETRGGEPSPEHGWSHLSAHPRSRPFRKVQIIYYLCRNGQLEHPHFLELTHLPNHHLRLKDVVHRLAILRGSAMPSLYSWSCKRAYRNGFVWNDLAEDDVIHPSHGAEYILKGSEIIPPAVRFETATPSNETRGSEPEEKEEEVDVFPASTSSSEAPKADCTGVSSPMAPETSGRRVPSVVLRMIACGSAAAKGRPAGLLLLGGSTGGPASVDGDANGEKGRFRDRQAEVGLGRECFSGSVVGGEVTGEGTVGGGGSGPLIVRSTMYDDARRQEESAEEEDELEERIIRGKCMPSRRWIKSKK